MQIGEVIRKYRKKKNMTQEEMANRLGVTAPAVNKWENGNALPDILLLSPIARLLDISLDTLLSFHGELTAEEIGNIIRELDQKLKKESYEDAFQWVKQQLAQYPNSEQLVWQTTVILDARRLTDKIPGAETYEPYFYSCYTRVLESKDGNLRRSAADSLFGFHIRKEEYEEAEKYLSYFSDQDPLKKIKQAQIYAGTDRIAEACKEYEELLFSNYQVISGAFYSACELALRQGDLERARMLTEKQEKLAELFEMGEYAKYSCRLILAKAEKDAAETASIMEKLLSSINDLGSFCKSPLYAHMSFREPTEDFRENVRRLLLDSDPALDV